MKLINKASFVKLPANKRRILIARDVLERLDKGNIIPSGGNFWRNKPAYHFDGPTVQEYVNDEFSKCSVCAKGAIFVSWVGNFNEVSWNHIGYRHYDLNTNNYPTELLDVFDRETLDNIEAAFEGKPFDYHYNEDYTKEYANAFIQFGDGGSEERLRAVMQYIIDNNGEFSLPNSDG